MQPMNMELMLEMLERAQQIAREAHAGQVDKAGRDYIDHPRRVAENCLTVPHDISQTDSMQLAVAGWLHDVLEDGPSNGYRPNLDEWEDFFGADIVEAVKLVTYRKKPIPPGRSSIEKRALTVGDKIDYYLRLGDNVIARAVKLADLADNCNEQRSRKLQNLNVPFDKNKYPLALAVINPTQDEWEWFREAIKKEVH